MELQILNNIQNRIEWDSDGAKSAVTALIAPYRDLVVTEDNVKDMEKAQKELASMRRKIDKFRKDTKKIAEAPIKAFETEVAGIQKVISDAEYPLQEQLKKYELQRIAEVQKLIMADAVQAAAREGLREQYMFDFTINSSWTNRTAKKAVVLKEINDKILELKNRQDIDDARVRLAEINRKQIALLCETMSEKYSLNSAIKPSDCPRGIEETDNPELLTGVIEDIARKRADVELAAMKMAEPTPEVAQEVPPIVIDAEVLEEKYDVTIKLNGVHKEVVGKLTAGKKLLGYEYSLEVIKHE